MLCYSVTPLSIRSFGPRFRSVCKRPSELGGSDEVFGRGADGTLSAVHFPAPDGLPAAPTKIWSRGVDTTVGHLPLVSSFSCVPPCDRKRHSCQAPRLESFAWRSRHDAYSGALNARPYMAHNGTRAARMPFASRGLLLRCHAWPQRSNFGCDMHGDSPLRLARFPSSSGTQFRTPRR